MPVLRSAILFLVSTGVALGSPLQGRSEVYAVKDAHPVPRHWSKIGDAPRRHVLKLEIALKQGRFADLDRHLMEG
jgi:tripeptidyl-peptidase I